MKIIETGIKTEFIRLDTFLKLTGAALSGGQAKVQIQDEKVSVNDEKCTQRGRKLHPGDKITISGEETVYKVGRVNPDNAVYPSNPETKA